MELQQCAGQCRHATLLFIIFEILANVNQKTAARRISRPAERGWNMERQSMEDRQDVQRQKEEKKEYLLGYRKYRQQAKRLEEQLAELKMGKALPKVILSGMPGAKNQKDLSDYIVRCDGLIGQIMEARKNALEQFADVQRQIESMEDETEKTLLTLRYLRNWKWNDIAFEIGVEWTHVHRIHGKALMHLKIEKRV